VPNTEKCSGQVSFSKGLWGPGSIARFFLAQVSSSTHGLRKIENKVARQVQESNFTYLVKTGLPGKFSSQVSLAVSLVAR